MNPPLKIIEVQQTGKRREWAHLRLAGGGGKFQWIDVPVYPPNANALLLREARRDAYLSIQDTCRRLGIRAGELGGLEIGHYTLSDGDWERLFAVVNGAS